MNELADMEEDVTDLNNSLDDVKHCIIKDEGVRADFSAYNFVDLIDILDDIYEIVK